VPEHYGDDPKAFIHNSTAKPITAYKFNKFKDMQKMRGIKFEKHHSENSVAGRSCRKREHRSHEQDAKLSLNKNANGQHNIIKFKNSGVQLYTDEDRQKFGSKTRKQSLPNRASMLTGDDTFSETEEHPTAMSTLPISALEKDKDNLNADLQKPIRKKDDLFG